MPLNTPSHTGRLRFAVMGAGAVGCYFGALLARAGHAVTLIGRPDHVQAIQAHGLRLQTATQDTHVPLEGRPTEIGHLNGYVVQRGAALGVATPVNRALLVLVRMAEASGVRGPQDHQKT
ncbi:ketopantoate reductase family protein [Diaphorobacter nitroreducens]|uniref:ketopantoate reductase family protein n=1 Tax=Diaphorobacter nitroreducens TaxID=164759 RepID=UPI0035B09CE4